VPVEADSGSAPVVVAVEDLAKTFTLGRGLLARGAAQVRAVDGISFSVGRRETLGLVGETGCGKSTTGRLLVRLLEPSGGRVFFDGRDITHLSNRELRRSRRHFQIVLQDPFSSLNPRHSVGAIVGAPYQAQGVRTERPVRLEVQEVLERVGLARDYANRYPHELSGGQKQRVAIARAIALRPKFIVCDEPTSALDVSVRAQIVNLLVELQQTLEIAYVFISHDLPLVRHIADRVAVMYLGKIVELGRSADLYARPLHPYTLALISATPISDPVVERQRERVVLRGDVPSAIAPPSGCRFHTRCWKAREICKSEEPRLLPVADGRTVACHFPENAP
jgi:oligopeptide/dipeptide ABC transporter ATP-binding protein